MSKLIFFIFISLVAVLDGKFRCDYTYFNDANGYLKLHRIPANWQEARLRCYLEGTFLASPLNENMSTAMKTLMKRENIVKCGIFTGVHAFFSRGDFHSIEGIPLRDIPHKWAEDEPDNYNEIERCIMMLPNGELADVNCSEPLPYVCHKKGPKSLLINECGTVDREYTLDPRTGSCYKLHKILRTWSRAYMACTAEGAHLAIINSETEAQVIRDIFDKNPAYRHLWNDGVFIGYHDWREHGEFITIEGQTLQEAGYSKFGSGEPNNATTGEFCGAVYGNGLLNDLFCEKRYAFICEKRPESLLCDNV